MTERMFVQGNEAVGWGALNAGCDGFFGYPITPQNEIPEWFAREFPKRGRVFVQSQSETGSINMLYGGAAAGFRVITSTSGPGWGLMQEGMSHIAAAELPCVVVLVQRGGPGAGSVRHAQMDYLSATRGGGQGGYKNIVLAPSSVQEVHDFVQLAFYLADKYCNPVVVLSDGIMGLIMESFEMKTIEFGPLPEKTWAIRGRENQKDGMTHLLHSAPGVAPSRGYMTYLSWLEHMDQKYKQMADAEVRYEMYQAEDAKLLLVAYGYPSRVSKEAIKMARSQGLKVGLIRPITLWPFPTQIIREKADQGYRFLVVEDSLGQIVDDVRMAVQGRTDVALLGVQARHLPTDGEMILPGRVLQEIRRLL